MTLIIFCFRSLVTRNCSWKILHPTAMNLITNAYHALEGIEGKLSVMLRDVHISIDDVG